jgi:glucose-1-phosphate thymidylyltransferase
MQPIVLLAGNGERFKNYSKLIKPMIQVGNKSIIEWTMDSIKHLHYNPPIFVIRREHANQYCLDEFLFERFEGCQVQYLAEPTRGNLETALLGAKGINGKVLFLDGDNYFDLTDLPHNYKADSVICCFKPEKIEPKWSFAVLTRSNQVLEVVEKKYPTRPHLPLMGAFYFKSAAQFRKTAEYILANDCTENGEYYMSQAISSMCGKFDVRAIIANWVFPMGTPEDVELTKERLCG